MSEIKKLYAQKAKVSHTNWKKGNIKNNIGYFIIFQTFKNDNILKRISGSALKLYIYLGLHTKNYSGECTVTIKSIAKYFGKNERTISYWIKELEELGLIERIQFEINKPAHTFLKPY